MAEKPSKWTVIGQSVRGASHLRSGRPNQDAIAYNTGMDGTSPVVLAVSDGHGSSKSFRSDIGANIAVKVAIEATSEFLSGMTKSPLPYIKDAAERLLTADIVKAWIQEVGEHFARTPFSPEELNHLEREAGEPARRAVMSAGKHQIAYGATLLVVAVSDLFMFYLQLGDGDIVTVSGKLRQVEHPLPQDASLIANETTSLCMDGAKKLFRFRFQVLQEAPPALILVSTDGYSNAFSTDADFYKVGSDLLDMVQKNGLVSIQRDLESWLNNASQDGSGDDVTLGIICRNDIAGNAGMRGEVTQNESKVDGAGDDASATGHART